MSTPLPNGDLPLNIACDFNRRISTLKLAYNAFPDAISMENEDRKSPGFIAEENDEDREITKFLREELEMVVQALADKTPDKNGQLPIHRTLWYSDILVGTIQLMAKANPEGLVLANKQGLIPLHIACQFDDVDRFRCLVEASEDSLLIRDADGNLPLHIACLEGL